MRKWIAQFLGLLALLLISLPSFAEQGIHYFNMTEGVTPISRDIYDLHMTIFWICVAIGVVVFGVMIYSLIHHRKSKGYQAAQFHGSVKLEIVWVVIPFLILVAMAIPATIVLMRMDDDSHADINIKITGYQWKWKYEYLDQGISFFSNLSTPQSQIKNKTKKGKWYLLEVDKPLVLPIHKKIRFLVTSNDVIHSWWVPALGIKRDAIPGYIYQAWARIDRPGIYRGQCAELCGAHHAFMPIVVVAKTQEGFDKWVAKQTHVHLNQPATPSKPMTKDKLMTAGKKVYGTYCSVCHKADGSGQPPVFPALKAGKITVGPVAGHIDIVLNGKQGTAMQAFGNQLSDTDLAAVITYERNNWGNANQKKYGDNAGGIVQPAEIAKARKP
ncbi:MAG: cytochrome c oxidase subunit II [Gammaproteobacteria bacterium]|nr:cytochrome c oxidase subunit II [Gammaproteobacteria bacterium]